MSWRKITLIGVGMLGGSLGLACKARRLAERVEGYVRRSASISECEAMGAVDHATCDLAAAVRGADLVILCTPPSQMPALAAQFERTLRSGAVVTDVGSVKAGLVNTLEPIIDRAGGRFIGSHPMAGAEKMGVGAARADLFQDAACVVTPTPRSDAGAIGQVTQFWRDVGARVITLAPEEHDALVGRSSHLVHVAAAALAAAVLDPRHPPAQAELCASGFRDTTRVASGSPEMWRDIALANRVALDRAVEEYLGGLQEFQRMLRAGDAAGLEAFFAEAKRRRDAWRRAESPAG